MSDVEGGHNPNKAAVAGILVQKELATDVRQAVDRLRNYGITLKDVHAAIAGEIGRTSAALPDREEFLRWMSDFMRRAIAAYDQERAELERRAEIAPRVRRRLRRRAF